MAEVRAQSGVPVLAQFTGTGAPTFCPPLVVDSATGFIYSWKTGDVIVAAGAGGTVTSVAETFTGGIISVAGSPITTSGTLALTVAGTSGGIPYFSGATTWASSNALTASALVLGGGAGNAPSTPVGLGTTTTLLHGNAGGAPTWGAVTLNTETTGQLSFANGGTGSNLTASTGGILYSTSTNGAILAGTATAGQILRSGASAAPTWSTATYPATATTAGHVLRADGTNWADATLAATDLSDYATGTWTPNQGSGLTLVGAFSSSARYTKIGRQVLVEGQVDGATSVAVAAVGDICSNLPFTAATLALGGATNNAVNAFAGTVCSGTRLIAITAIAATTHIFFSLAYSV